MPWHFHYIKVSKHFSMVKQAEAEDNQDNVLLIKVFKKQTAHRLDVAEDGLVALEIYRANHYDVLLMDIQDQ